MQLKDSMGVRSRSMACYSSRQRSQLLLHRLPQQEQLLRVLLERSACRSCWDSASQSACLDVSCACPAAGGVPAALLECHPANNSSTGSLLNKIRPRDVEAAMLFSYHEEPPCRHAWEVSTGASCVRKPVALRLCGCKRCQASTGT